MRFKNFPIVDARLPRRSGVSDNETRIELLSSDRNRLAMDTVGFEMNRVHPAVESGIVILASGRNADELRFHVLRDHANLFQRELAPGEAGESGSGGDNEGGRAGDAGAGRGFGVGLESEAAFWRKESDKIRGERMRK